MLHNFPVPRGYQDLSSQSEGYFAFRFLCQQCGWSVETTPIRSTVKTAQNVLDIGVGMLSGFWGRAAEAGEQIYGEKWHREEAQALQKAWGEVDHEFRLCPECHRTVCLRCFNEKLKLCTGCAPDLRAVGTQFVHEKDIAAQNKQIEKSYQAPSFNVDDLPSAVEPDMVMPQSQAHMPSVPPQMNKPTNAPTVACPTCHQMGLAGKFCQACGTKLPLPALVCPKCSSSVESTAHFCPECGAKL